jgi:HTH-type transcriptional regulator/antitoxin HigA
MGVKDNGKEIKPFYNPGPGDIIKDAMEELGWQQDDLAKKSGLSLKTVNLILNNKQSITPKTADLLGKTFSTSAEMWLKLESNYKIRKTSNII